MLICRTATRADLDAIIELLADDEIGTNRESLSATDRPSYEQAWSALDAQAGNQVLLALDGEQIVGVLQLTVIPGLARKGMLRAQIEGVRVSSAQRGKKIGEWLIEQAVLRAKEAGCGLLQLTTDNRRHDAKRFYERLGFLATHQGMKREL